MNACDNISGLSRELVSLAISLTTAELRVFVQVCAKEGVTSAESVESQSCHQGQLSSFAD
jgi:hypothetical protein